MTNNTIYIAWRNANNTSSGWYVVGALKQENNEYTFNYTNGVKMIKNGFAPFSGMNDLDKIYSSESLFPLFQNRLLSKRRPEYPQLIKWMGFEKTSEPEPIEMLALTGAFRATDQFEMFNGISISEDGNFEHVFFAHGFKYFPDRSQSRINELQVGEELKLILDKQNDVDPHAVLIRTKEPTEIIAYCPRYIAKNIHDILVDQPQKIKINVELVNNDAPTSYQLLCKLSGNVDSEFKFMDGLEYEQYTP